MRLKDGAVATIALTARDEDEAAEELLEHAPELTVPASDIAADGAGVEDFEEEVNTDGSDDNEI